MSDKLKTDKVILAISVDGKVARRMQRLADSKGVTRTALGRMWLLERLRDEAPASTRRRK